MLSIVTLCLERKPWGADLNHTSISVFLTSVWKQKRANELKAMNHASMLGHINHTKTRSEGVEKMNFCCLSSHLIWLQTAALVWYGTAGDGCTLSLGSWDVPFICTKDFSLSPLIDYPWCCPLSDPSWVIYDSCFAQSSTQRPRDYLKEMGLRWEHDGWRTWKTEEEANHCRLQNPTSVCSCNCNCTWCVTTVCM